MKVVHMLGILAALLWPWRSSVGQTADTIYTGGDIVTVNDAQPAVEALAVQGNKILAVGDLADVLKTKGSDTRMVDLGGKALLPGFIDPHSHLSMYVMWWGLPNLSPPPVGEVRRISDIVDMMRVHREKNNIPPGELILGNGYDDSLLEEQRHPTREELDSISTNHPVLIVHASGHLLAANSMALEKVGYSRETVDPEGGKIRRSADGELTGVCEELAAIPFLSLIKPKDLEQRLLDVVAIQKLYARYGITTLQDGLSLPPDITLLQEAARRELFFLDVVSYPRFDTFSDVLRGERTLDIEYHPPAMGCCSPSAHPTNRMSSPAVIKDASKVQVGIYQNRFKIGGIKITADGSPQGKTAYLTKPYVRPPAGQPADYRGYPTISQEDLDLWFDAAYTHDVQLLVHCNGDAAADMMIASVRKAVAAHGQKDLRPVMIHAQMIRHDQVDAMAELGIVPSFFTAHTYYWGDWHINETVGKARAYGMSPTGYALQKGLRFTNHSDAPIVPPDPLMIMWTAVNRLSRSGVVVGPDECITPLEALKATTIHAARQYFEEKDKGTLEPGKIADLVILDRNPLTSAPDTIREIRVLHTIKDGKVVYSATDN